jgi:hypothetical protein
MQKDPLAYIEALPMPQLAFADSPEFQLEVDRVTAKFQQKEKEKAQSKPKHKEALSDLPKKLVSSELQAVGKQVQANVIAYEHSVDK